MLTKVDSSSNVGAKVVSEVEAEMEADVVVVVVVVVVIVVITDGKAIGNDIFEPDDSNVDVVVGVVDVVVVASNSCKANASRHFPCL